MAGPSIVEYFTGSEGHRCGYCGSSDTNRSNGMWAHKLTCKDYQDLIDRGWRRSGKYCYKPLMNQTCCPAYTIRCKALEFKATKSQKKVLKHMTKYLTSDIKMKEMHGNDDENQSGKDKDVKRKDSPLNPDETVQTDHHKEKPEPRPGLGPDANKPPCRKAKLIRKERKRQKLAASGVECDSAYTQAGHQNTAKSLEDLLFEYSKHSNILHKLEIKLVHADMESEEFKSTFKQSYNVYKNYQVSIHKDPPDKCTERQSLTPSFFQFQRFLCDSPLMHDKRSGAPHMGYGSFHQQYYLDGVLIAVAVLDILPRCVSSVYLYYEPSYGFLSLGTYSTLREIYFTQQLYRQVPSIESYYMGFYIHSCPKMRYKGNYYPSFLVCPETYNWVPIEKCRPKLDSSKYSRLDDVSPGGFLSSEGRLPVLCE
ncbi:arginyl-tRNA--protein transferase 1-like [Actinia tenebrosa]|uniref:Arginyl-tRNA--protein transferase 1 n=1 Tax=Actinia tenebrosa TaxID=6105 RepID=A0A6P8IT42_ACTTE|nr:arginyl-tRNA--protein transferase 1-like [Actinia tenebrosa]